MKKIIFLSIITCSFFLPFHVQEINNKINPVEENTVNPSILKREKQSLSTILKQVLLIGKKKMLFV